MSKKPHVHAEVIKAWAEGNEIEWRATDSEGWRAIKSPAWEDGMQYRVKVEKQYPETALTKDQLNHVFNACGQPRTSLQRVADAALRHAIDSGQLPTKEAYDQCRAALVNAEHLLGLLGYEYDPNGEWQLAGDAAAPAPSQPAGAAKGRDGEAECSAEVAERYFPRLYGSIKGGSI